MTDIKFVDNDIEQLELTLKKGYEEIMQVNVKDGDPVSDFISWVTYILSITNNNINHTGKMNLLRYSEGIYLEALGELVGVKRNLAKGAKATIKYTFSKIFDEVITIPKGHKVASGNLFFELDEDIELQIGKRDIIGYVTCLTEGVVGNNIQIGKINTIVDDIPYLYTVENTNVSFGGTDKETDEKLRERIRLKPTSFSTAGPTMAYKYHTLMAHQDISDAYVYTLESTPGIVKVVPLMKNGVIPSEEMLNYISQVLSSDDIRPLTDKVEVVIPTVSKYLITVKWWSNEKDNISLLTSNVNKAIKEYIAWQKEKLGRDISPNKLVQYLIQAGAKRVEVINPRFIKLEKTEIAQEIVAEVYYQGVDNE